MTPYRHIPTRSKQPPRRGAVLIITIVCVAIALAILVGLVHIALLRHATQKNHLRGAQAACLVESGLNRAVSRLAADPTYEGETWTIPAAEFNKADSNGNSQPALVRIKVKTIADSPDKREILIQADYPSDPKLRARRSKQTTVTLTQSKAIESETEKPKLETEKQKP